MIIVLLAAFWVVSGGQKLTTRVRIDGRTVWITGHKPTVAAALAAARVRPKDGALLSVVTHRVIDAHATPAEVSVDGAVAEPGQRVRAGDRIAVKNGGDVTES